MDTTSSISTWTTLIQQFSPVFTAPGAQMFLALVCGWVLCTGRHTMTGILPFADPVGQHAHDAFQRFLPDAHWDMNALWKLLTVLVVNAFAASGVIELDLDDTLFHRCGRQVAGAGWLPERAFRLHADGFYATLAGRGLVRLHLISRMRRDAELYEPLAPTRGKRKRGRPRQKGRRLWTPEKMARRVPSWQLVPTTERGKVHKRLVYACPVLWYRVSKMPVLLVISRDPTGKERDDFFFSTDRSLKPAQVIAGFAGRWSIEDTFKNTKQFIAGQELQTWKGQGPERAAMLSLWLSSVVWLWYLNQKGRLRQVTIPPWYPEKVHASFQDALASLRRHL